MKIERYPKSGLYEAKYQGVTGLGHSHFEAISECLETLQDFEIIKRWSHSE